MFLVVNEWIKTKERDKSINVENIKEIIEDEHLWDDIGEQGEKIQTVLKQCTYNFSILDIWQEYLENNLKLPCKVI